MSSGQTVAFSTTSAAQSSAAEAKFKAASLELKAYSASLCLRTPTCGFPVKGASNIPNIMQSKLFYIPSSVRNIFFHVLESCFHIHCSSNRFLWARWKSDLKRRSLQEHFLTSVLVQYSVYTVWWKYGARTKQRKRHLVTFVYEENNTWKEKSVSPHKCVAAESIIL